MPFRSIRVINWGIVGIWLLLLGILFYRHYVSGVELSPIRAMTGDAFRIKDQWFGIYQSGEKVGYMHLTTEKIGDEYRFIQDTTIQVEQKGGTTEVTNRLKCLSDSSYRLKSFDFESKSGASHYKAHGEYSDGLLVMFMEKDGEHRAVNREMKEAPYFPLTVKSALFEQGLTEGMRIRLPVLDLLTLQVPEGTAEVEELVPVKSGINVLTAYRIRFAYRDANHSSELWISDGGMCTLREELPDGTVIFYEPEEVAKADGDRSRLLDYLMIPTVKSNQVIGNPSSVRRMVVKISGVEVKDFPGLHGDYQSMTQNVVEVIRIDEEELKSKSYDVPYTMDNLATYVKPTPWVQSNAPEIKEFSRAVRGVVNDAYKVARTYTGRLYNWIISQPTTWIPTSLEAHTIRHGECLDYTVLYTAIARAAGLPARMVGGLVPVRGFFYFHTWAEVWIGRWVPVDPTRGECPASAARIRFVIGDMEELVSFTKAIDRIQIEVLEVL